MTKYKFICRSISIVIAVILAIILSYFLRIDDVSCIDILKSNHSNKEDYALLKEYAISYASTLDKKSIPESINVTHTFEEENILITLDNGITKIDAKYPIKFESQGEGDFCVNISYKDGIYMEYINNQNISVYITAILLFFIFAAILIYFIVYFMFLQIRKFVIKNKYLKK